ncbi:SDR family NAD(P)-dependent oxidoreductase [Halomonas stenophila]|uniref:NAD(P)-dependent dehydrogenase (Short-subunit alcohol dehydrogenase family) n=1 Tax=Halomonas stenophila TaxID=795312 RepID=A0A7W5EQJ0_9GAMM|nr:SDR family NAD(P)-dependent oxidoreductase [Halomonas stenophila]MBB3229628.1 NAD(P)-dependent dehydrogenase (short-subunit alcohol dehydrogenase family) [Halomonas stenophila]
MNKVCAIVGVGPGNGLALVRRFAREGYRVAMLSRDIDRLTGWEQEIPGSHAYRFDATEGERAHAVFKQVREELGAVSVLLFNAGGGIFKSAEQVTLQEFEDSWRINCYGLLATVQAALGQLREHDQACLVITGASAALRGRAATAPFASAKAGQRSLAQSLARQLGPENIHVAYVVIDGVVDLPRTREAMPDKPDDFFLSPDAVADSVWFLTRQARSAWTFELDLRPFGETW